MSSLPQVINTVMEMRSWRRRQTRKIGFVPTMGALHEGHASLLRRARKESELTVLSVFVNATQFAPGEDLARYPKTWEADLAIAQSEGVDLVFAPTAAEMYPEGYTTFVEETSVSQPLCGQFRPGHFRGVATVVLKLFNLVQPAQAFFGLKDAQQYYVLKQMVKDLNLDLEMKGVPTLRAEDGLALSSRNVYLSEAERKTAPLIYQTLIQARNELQNSAQARTTSHLDVHAVLERARQALASSGFTVQYLDYLSLPDLKPLSRFREPSLLAVAAYLGKTRLIDNLCFTE